jgi:hypothetical protein
MASLVLFTFSFIYPVVLNRFWHAMIFSKVSTSFKTVVLINFEFSTHLMHSSNKIQSIDYWVVPAWYMEGTLLDPKLPNQSAVRFILLGL